MESKVKDYTNSHSQQFTDAQGRKHVVIKPMKVIKTPNADGGTDVTIVVPRLSLKPKVNPV